MTHEPDGPMTSMIAAEPPFEVVEPDGAHQPIIVHVPHSSTVIPAEVRAGISVDEATLAEEVRRLTDHRTDVLAADVGGYGATRFINRRSRLVVDPERLPDDREPLAEIGMGAVYRATSDLTRLRRADPAAESDLIERYGVPYAAALTRLVAHQLNEAGECTIIDLHSYTQHALPYERAPVEPRPQVCVGTHPLHTPAWLQDLVVGCADTAGFGTAMDVPFEGTYVPLQWYGIDERVRSIMLEVRRDTYLDEASAQPHVGERAVRDFVTDVVRQVSRRRPGRSDR